MEGRTTRTFWSGSAGKPMILSRPDAKIFLVGFMGTGKTTLGRLLAARLGWAFQDIDEAVEAREEASIIRIFIEKGEAYFRSRESRALAEIAASPGLAVIACGGGTFCAPENQAVMHRHGITVWVDQPFDRIWQRRAELGRHRPLLSSESEVRHLYEGRARVYRLATLHLPVAEGSLPAAVETLLGLLRESGCLE